MQIRNFVIISHVDHGKSTLADRLLEVTGTISKDKLVPQFLDRMPLERERGITIKMQPVRMLWHSDRGITQNETRNNADNMREDAEFLYGDITYKIRGALFAVRKKIGLGHKEQIYHNALEIEFKNAGLSFESKKNVPVLYEGKRIGVYQPDFVIDDKVIIELKALPEIGKPQVEQLWSYLKGCHYKLALLVNFGSRDVEMKRIIYDLARESSISAGTSLRGSASSQRESAQVEDVILNLIDTPGHSDFSYEVSRGLAAVEGAVLLVDATKGVQAQTLANFHLAERQGLTIIPAINKIDLPTARIEKCAEQFREILGIDEGEILHISGKTGIGVDALLERIIERVSRPAGDAEGPLRALVFDSHFDVHKGIIAYMRIFSGTLKARDSVRLFHADAQVKIGEIGVFRPNLTEVETLGPGEIGYIATGLKDASLVRVGDTIVTADTHRRNADSRGNFSASHQHEPALREPLPGYKEPQPLVFASFYPMSEEGFTVLKVSLEKLHLNDAAFTFEEEAGFVIGGNKTRRRGSGATEDSAETLGRGFRCGFLGTLHQEIVEERLKREYGQEVIVTQPSVALEVVDTLGKTHSLYRPRDFDRAKVREVREPWLRLTIFLPPHLLSQLIKILPNYRAYSTETKTLGAQTVSVEIEIPLAEFFTDFAEVIQSAVSGYASFSYEPIGMRAGDLVRFEILVHGEPQEAFSQVVHRIRAERIARDRLEKLKAYMPKQLFPVALQATIDGAIVARETVPAMRKDVTGYLYGGDITRKKKLLAKQKKGKKLLAEKGAVSIPPEVFRRMARS